MREALSRTLFVALSLVGTVAIATATTFTTSSSGVFFSVTDVQFYVRSTEIPPGPSSPGLDASSDISGSNFHLSATASPPGYSDAGIVLYFDGGRRLGLLQSVSVTSTGSPLSINLWFDTGGDGKFFKFGATDNLTGLNGDSFGSSSGSLLNAASSIYMQAGAGGGGTYTLAELQGGAVTGIDGDTLTALWIGITNTNTADISGITVDSLPEPASLFLVGLGLTGLSLAARRLRK